jgi:imidazolonepropionase-like amidohydrolase
MHQELALFVDACGFTPLEALRSATSAPAKRLKFADRGFIKEGLRADLLLVEGDPTQDIDHTLDLRGVWTEGKLCSAYEASFES